MKSNINRYNLVFDCVGGASGDMILGALSGLYGNTDELKKILENMMPEEEFNIKRVKKKRFGLSGYETYVEIHQQSPHNIHTPSPRKHSHIHRNLTDIQKLINSSKCTDKAKYLANKTFEKLAKAEAKVHGTEINKIHFHEVGAVDSIIDIVGSCYFLDKLNIISVSVSPLPLGTGSISCAHGIIPLPAPATLEILRESDMPVSGTDEQHELVTPTGAALLATFKEEYPVKKHNTESIIKSVYSFGHRELTKIPNFLRVTLFQTSDSKFPVTMEYIHVLQTNIDDISPELIGALYPKLFTAGALDVFTQPAYMKKQRPGILLNVLCHEKDKKRLIKTIFEETTTFGIRETKVKRYYLDRKIEKINTEYGEIRIKRGFIGDKITSVAPEIEDCITAAQRYNIPVKTVMRSVIKKINL